MVFAKLKLRSILTLWLAIALAGTLVGAVHADSGADGATGWLEQDYPYMIVDQSLADALREFGRNVDVSTEVSTRIKGRVRRYEHDGSSGDFLRHLASEHGFDWVFDGGRLFVSARDEQVDRSWPAGAGAFEAVETTLVKAGIGDARYPVGFDPGQGVLRLSAPPRYMALAAPVIDRLLAPARATRTVNVIHGRSRDGGT